MLKDFGEVYARDLILIVKHDVHAQVLIFKQHRNLNDDIAALLDFIGGLYFF